MKRDMDLVRLILMETEKADAYIDIEQLACDRYPLQTIGYHVELMTARGLIDAELQKAWGGMVVNGTILALTWDGCDYLDAIRDEKVWARTKKAVKETVGDTTMDVIKSVASAVAFGLIQSSLGIST